MNRTRHNPPAALEPMPALHPGVEAALAHKPAPVISAGFAANVAARAATLLQRRRRPAPQFGPAVAWLSMLGAAVALFALAPHTAPRFTNLRFDTELLLLAELAAIGWGIARGLGQPGLH